MSFKTPVLPPGNENAGKEIVVHSPTLKLQNAKGKGKEVELSDQEKEVAGYKFWAPNSICRDSHLTYGSAPADWEGIKLDAESGHYCRKISFEREGLFRASGVLFGVRFVVGLVLTSSSLQPYLKLGIL